MDLARFINEISHEIDGLCGLCFSKEELDYLRGLRFMKPDFVDFLGLFHLDRKQPAIACLVPGAGRD